MKMRDMVWAAGLFEGEGTIRINALTKRNLGTLIVSVVNTDLEVVRFFQDRWPGYMKPAAGLGPRQRDAWVWVVAAWKAARFLRDTGPHLVTRRVRHKAAVALVFQRGKRRCHKECRSFEYVERQWNWWQYMCHLNLRGRQPPLPPMQLPLMEMPF